MSEGAETQAREAEIRRASPGEAAILNALSLRSKGHWGYDAGFLEACRSDLALSPEEITGFPVFVHEGLNGPDGYYRIIALDKGVAELDALFVDPVAIGTGVGRRLWEHAIATARELSFTDLMIHSDPYAEGFYTAMGARRIGESASTVAPGRMLPLMHFSPR